MFLFLASHGARHGWSRLRWLEDIKQLIEFELDWVKIKELLNDFHFLNVGEQSIFLASNLLNAKIPEGFHKFHSHSKNLAQQAIFYFENMVNLHSEPVPEYVAKYHQRHLFSLMSFQQKIVFLISLLHPYPEDLETLPLPKHLHFLYYPLRPYLMGMEKIEICTTPKGDSDMSNVIYFLKKQLHSYSGKILYFNLFTMMLIGLLEGVGILLLIPLIGMTGIVDIDVESIPFSTFFWFLGEIFQLHGDYLFILVFFIVLVNSQHIVQRRITIRNTTIQQGFLNYMRKETYRRVLHANWSFYIKK